MCLLFKGQPAYSLRAWGHGGLAARVHRVYRSAYRVIPYGMCQLVYVTDPNRYDPPGLRGLMDYMHILEVLMFRV